ncbi:penicillin acylase family protein [Deinococcus peraridilitoris]|nr:penicillin acylase family protein [Deinococcus peraridilitoris]
MPDLAEILWDTWGVPHVFARSEEAAFRAFGWAQMHAHGDLLLRLYGLARGRGAEYWGEKYLASDRLIRQMGVAQRAPVWLAAQEREMHANITAFVNGVNAYAEGHADALAPDTRAVLPVTPDDVFAHIQRVYLVYLTLGGQRPAGEPYNDILPYSTLLPDAPAMGTGVAGSNAWAVGGSRSESGHGLLLANPHLYWGDAHTFFEAHLNISQNGQPDLNLYGVAQVGWPVLRYGFNEHLGWAHTVNTLKGWDAFALTPNGDGYLLDGEKRAFTVRHETLLVRAPDGALRTEHLKVLESEHGPVVTEQDGRPVAVRCVGLDVAPIPGIFAQYWAMAQARDHGEFERALARHQNAMFNVLYADTDGHAAYYFTGLVPRRAGGHWSDWAGTLSGDRRELIWHEVHDFSELPRLVDPPSGWLQNANNPPWLATLPPALDPAAFPGYLSPQMVTPREQRSIRMLRSLERPTLEDLMACVNDTRSETAERLVPPLLEAAERSGSELARQAAGVLAGWDHRFDSASAQAHLFSRWLVGLGANRTLSNVTREPWQESEPLDTPRGLADEGAALSALEQAASALLQEYGSLERPWGTLTHARRGEYSVPGHGHLDPFGVFRVSGFQPAAEGMFDMAFGTTYIAAIEFSRPVRARVLLAYGNSSQPNSPHVGDQLPLFARGELRPAWLTRPEVEAHLARRDEVCSIDG